MDMKIILLVEDDAIIALTEKMSLETYGYSVVTVSSGEKALKTMKERADIDLILMDIDLGTGIDGTEAAEHISTFAAKTPYLRRNYYLDK